MQCCGATRSSATVAEMLSRSDGVDILVNNAGITYYGNVERMAADHWDRLMRVNLLSHIQFTRELLPSLFARQEAHVLNVCSVLGLVGMPKVTAYCASKFGMVGFSEALRNELGRQGLGVTALCPGFVRRICLPTGKRNTPMVVSFLAIGANLFLNWLFTFRLGWGHRGLAFSTGLVANINFLLLYTLMRRHTRRLETRQMLIALGKICVAGALLALICWAANYLWLDAWSDMRFFQKVAILLATIAVAGAGFFGAAFLLRISEVQDIIDVFRRRFH